ncbi:hypothetical protein [Neorhodopirellula pilleata]|uniref:Uncharacterized protein n=1 Tax=Neorhodopirellula pilleata TaxID=2714738 RepID=A0A5C6AW33_9BACT|nr:hypothetical protein [Neorhodopirellula pilleata]TWU03828.1 hypothetical protein Pla100_07630 [Neorhodopirellula pilleata]
MRRRPAMDSSAIDYELSQIQRAQTERTLHRRADRSRRQRTVAITTLVFVALVVLALPSLVSRSPIGRSYLAQTMQAYGWQADADSLQIGWITPARVVGLRMVGARAGTEVSIGELQTNLTLPQLLGGEVNAGKFGEIVLRDVRLSGRISDRNSSVEEDLVDLLAPTDEPTTFTPDGNVQIQGLQIDLTDAVTNAMWSFKQANASAVITPTELQSQWQGVLSQPGGSDGSVQGTLVCSMMADALPASLSIESKSLPMSILSLVARRFPESELPAVITGDLSGTATLDIPSSGYPNVSLRKIELRNLAAFDSNDRRRLWSNELMQVNGDATWQPGRLFARQVTAKTDFAAVSIDGSFADSISLSGSQSNPLAWLDQVDATANIEIDLPRLNTALPELLPLREGATLQRGVVRATIEPMAPSVATRNSSNQNSQRRRRLVVQSDVIEATADGKPVRIAPMDATAIVASDATQLRAEQFEMLSPFARIRGLGDLASGSAELEINFGKLARMLQPIIQTNGQELQGDIVAKLRWNSSTNGIWRLQGESDINDLALQVAPQTLWQQKQLKSIIDVEGRLINRASTSTSAGGWSLEELSRGVITLAGDGFRADAELVQTIVGLDRNQMIPLRVRSEGKIESLIDLAMPWMPESLIGCRGGLNVTARASFNGNGEVSLQAIDGQLSSLRVPMSDRDFQQELVKVHFDGKAIWPRQEVTIQSMTVVGDALSAAMQGEWINSMTDIEIAWRADLDRLQTTTAKRIARDVAGDRPTALTNFTRPANATANTSEWKVRGKLEGNTTLVGDSLNLHVDTKISARNVELLETGKTTVSVWSEPAVEVEGKFKLDIARMSIQSESLQASTDWCGVNLAGTASYFNEIADVQLRGPARFQMDQVSNRLTKLSGTSIVAEGMHETPLEIMYAQNKQGQYAFTVKGNLGWETVDTAGMLFGPAEVPFKMTEDTVSISPSTIPVLGPSRLTPRMIGPQVAPLEPIAGSSISPGHGEIYVAGDVHYRPELWIELTPGPVAKNVKLTPDMTNKWLKYLAPIASDAARVEGSFGADLQQAVVYIDDPRRSQIRGRLEIDQVRMTAGPLADQVIAGARQLQALAAIGSNVRPPSTGSTLISLPAQTIEFQVAGGVVDHRALLLDVDRARVITSGQVDFDGRLNLMAQVPLDAKWLGSDLRSLAGQTMSLPIDGTLNRPSLDSAGIQKVVSQLGMKAAQDAAGNFLQEQLGRGQQQLEQGLNKSLERLRLDKLFGN